ncbi:hypothetical protein FJ444_17185 [Aestuariibacter sp. GS-14]|uniref:PTS glucose transporter subunit IIA n=1 Tax=Aestuariibacter sp. GS-14 TaxID=2590670 RepID=UPI00112CFE6F|nr:PTS glucose transporter subunit IIA [Aestuariibacter sp. GS-14]TPV55431.1 hypothetical protein FJ444_17185 [Aestuariibacter sp. GS-14]
MNYCFTTRITDSAPVAKKAALRITSPATGAILSLSDSPSAFYRERVLGEGIGIQLTRGEVYAPCSLVVSSIDPAKGSLNAVTSKGIKLLFQAGLPEFTGHGERLQFHVGTGDTVNAGMCLFTCDPLWMKQQGQQPCLYFTLLNAAPLAAIQCHASGSILALDDLLFTLYVHPK